jgi:sterol desaturase/sphingolipid hydroxylase (fatty acid hydroxylase superfamily)
MSGFTLLLACFFLVALWEVIRPRRSLENPVTARWIGNLAVYLINGALFALLFPSPSDATSWLEANLGFGVLEWLQSKSVVNFVIAFLFLDFSRYWFHRLFHALPVMWRLHSLHHADPDLDVSTSFRHHPIEFLVGSILFWLILVFTRFPLEIVGAYLLCASLLSCVQHGNIALPPFWDRALQKFVVTPDMHRLHHSIVQSEANSNFGFLFSFWDRLFATYRQIPRIEHDAVQFGLTGVREPSFARMMMLPLKVQTIAPPTNASQQAAPPDHVNRH